MYTLADIFHCMQESAEKIDDVKITHFERFGFTETSGYQYRINFKIVTKKGYQNKLVKVLTNSTYVDDYWDDDNDIKNNLLDMVYGELANAMPIENQ